MTSMVSKAGAQHPLIMLGIESYKGTRPPVKSTIATIAFLVFCLFCSEAISKLTLFENRSFHELLEIPVNRWILARHLGVDTLCCTTMGLLGWWNRAVGTRSILLAATGRDKSAMTEAGYESRLFAYHPGSFRIGVFFSAYQLKNLYDTILWDDGPEYVFHHLLSMMVSGGSLYPGLAPAYASFFLGLSEFSTAILCVLANFDDDHGVVGLGDAFPITKVAVGGLFVASFIVLRCIVWPTMSYYFIRDCQWALSGNSPGLKGRRFWVFSFMTCLTGLSLLQIVFLAQIYLVASTELKSMGFI